MSDKLIVLFFFLSTTSAFAQPRVVQWDFAVERNQGDTVTVILTATVDPGWYVYSQYLEGDGPIPTQVSFEKEDELTFLGKPEESGHLVEGYDDIFGMEIKKYKEEMVIRQQLILPEGENNISGKVLFMSCDQEQCLPPSEVEFSLEIE